MGIVLGIEMSRLARSGREWHQLLELCALSGALLGDPDGVYDPAEHNDRLLLGLKGTISEAELHLIKQRMWSGRVAKARRGELAVPLPAGFVRRPSGRGGAGSRTSRCAAWSGWSSTCSSGWARWAPCWVSWRTTASSWGCGCGRDPSAGSWPGAAPAGPALQNMLRNPAYAGIYAYGRSTLDPRRRQAGRPFTGRVRTARERLGGLPARGAARLYQHRAVRAEHGSGLDANRSRAQSLGAVRDGPALLAGLVACGRCGKKMTVALPARARAGSCTRSTCAPATRPTTAAASASSWPAPCVDALRHRAAAGTRWRRPRWRSPWPRPGRPRPSARRWTGSGGSAWNAPSSPPTGPAASTSSPSRKTAWSCRQLEKDWEAALAERQRLGEEYDRFTAARPRTLTAAEREQIRALAADLPAVWHAPTTTDADRKQLIRHLVEQVRVTVLGTSEKVDVEVVWAGGHRTTAQITRPVACLTQLSYYPQLAARARELAGSRAAPLAQIAERLNAEGFRPPKRSPAFTPNAVSDLLRALGIQRSRIPARRNRPALAQHEWWLRDLAAHLGMSEITLDSWVRRGWAAGYLHPQARLRVVRADPAEVERLRALHQMPRGQHNRRPWLKNQAAA